MNQAGNKVLSITLALTIFLLLTSQLVLIPIIALLTLFTITSLKFKPNLSIEDLLFFLFIGVSTISIIFAKNKELAVGGVLVLVLYYFVFNLGKNWRWEYSGIYWGGLVAVIILTIFGAIFYLFPDLALFIRVENINLIEIPSAKFFSHNSVLRSPSITPNPVIFSSSVLYIIPVILSWLITKLNDKPIAFWISILALSIIEVMVLVLSNSRSFLILAPLATLAVLYFSRQHKSIFVFTVVSISVFVILLGYISNFIIERIKLIFEWKDYTSLFNRLDAYGLGLNLFQTNPIVGIGLINFKEHVAPYFGNYIHNLYLSILVETGILGLTAFTSLLAVSLHKAIKNLVAKFEITKLGYMVSIFSFLTHGLIDNTLYVVPLGLLFWLFLGISIQSLPKKESESYNSQRCLQNNKEFTLSPNKSNNLDTSQ
ncbi:MAG: O-antigen ligase family protein [Brevinematia bacterium]